MHRHAFLRWAACAVLGPWLPPALSQQKILRIIVPYSPGGPTDSAARLIAPSISTQLGRTVVVENRPGAATLVAIRAVQAAPADGSLNVMLQNIGFVGLTFTNKSATYDPLSDFVPMAAIANDTARIYVHASVPARSLGEFIAFAKQSPAGVEVATSGPGGGSHTWTALLAKRANIHLVPVPYKGLAEMTAALVKGEAKLMISSGSGQLDEHVRAGNLRLLAIASDRKSALHPEVPLASDTIPGFAIAGWVGFIGGPQTTEADAAALSAAVQSALGEQGIRERFETLHMEPRHMGPREFASAIGAAKDFFGRLVLDLGITPQ